MLYGVGGKMECDTCGVIIEELDEDTAYALGWGSTEVRRGSEETDFWTCPHCISEE